ncbi:MAG: YhcH/YjgK/YiaL family protein [Desulfuromonadaceae bacterium]|nr:YhcH/YjgK/YiaL family protein [Desulfuromonadaceae bacterium]MDD2854723.1 YhcH/YjgK/YiaL family protein [Desulfuromonadaceae bacterium]
MIFDTLENLELYETVHPGFPDVRAFIAATDLLKLPVGRHPINDKGAYASVNEYNTKALEDSFIECHIKYIDLQMLVCGEEIIGVAPKKFCVEQPYNNENDLQKLSGKVDFITLVPGLFAIFFPQDAHEPGLKNIEQSIAVKKIVFKIPV